MKLLITFGTLTGNTEIVAESLRDYIVGNSGQLEGNNIEVDYLNNYEVEIEKLANYDFIIIGASTWGEGDLNPVSEDFLYRLNETNPDLTGKSVAVFGLGESHYEQYCKAADILMEKFTALGAKLEGEVLKIDGFPDEEILSTANTWIEKILASKV